MKFKNVFVLACGCNTTNTIGNSDACDKTSGQCPCSDGWTGRTCDEGTPYGIIKILAEGGGSGHGDTP